MGLVSRKENFEFFKQEFDAAQAIVLGNPKTVEFEIVRT